MIDLICPLDKELLIRHDGAWVCKNRHHFDIAKQGYVNLLNVQHKKSKQPGDSKEMVAARRDFLNAHYYQPLADKIVDFMLAEERASTLISVLDAGCGEGYYLDYLESQRSAAGAQGEYIGVDISKWAVLAAAKRSRNCRWFVASNRQLPFPDASFDWIVCGFGFPVWNEFYRLLKPEGKVLLLDPADGHLGRLKSIIYPRCAESVKSEAGEDKAKAQFEHQLQENVKFQFELTSNIQMSNLLKMTPHYFKAPRDGVDKLLSNNELSETVKVDFNLYSKPGLVV
ncbi:MAG: putative RNA methyltransferase [bacterium]